MNAVDRDMWTLGRIWIYPVKSLPGVEVSQTVILAAGNLLHDREFALIDDAGRFMNAKRTPDIHRIQATWDLENLSVTLSRAGENSPVTFHLNENLQGLSEWFSDFFRVPLTVVRKAEGGFPDDTEASGPTIISSATLQAVASWFPGLQVNDVRRRFRANLELEGGEPFSEDRLFGGPGELVPIQIGDARLLGSNPCQRCVVPTRDAATGEVWPGFQKEFAVQREASLAPTTNRVRFNHFYRLAVNTVVRHPASQTIRVGDRVRL